MERAVHLHRVASARAGGILQDLVADIPKDSIESGRQNCANEGPMLDSLESLSKQKVFSLAFDDAKESVTVPLSALHLDEPTGSGFSLNIDPSSQEACGHALMSLRRLKLLQDRRPVYFYVPSYIQRVTGPSIGLAAALAVMRLYEIIEGVSPLWATGEVSPFGSVFPVGGMSIKLSNPNIKKGTVLVPAGYQLPAGIAAHAVKDLEEVVRCLKLRP